LTNVMQLAFSSVNIEDSKQMKWLTEAAVRDSAAMKQISYLTMVFLPASFVASAFGMNIKEITDGTNGTLGHYAAAAIPLTLATIWIIVALQGRWQHKGGKHMSFARRLAWPLDYVQRGSKMTIESLGWIRKRTERNKAMSQMNIDNNKGELEGVVVHVAPVSS